MSLGENNCPAQVGKGDSLEGTTLTDLKITLFDIVSHLGEQSLAQGAERFPGFVPATPRLGLCAGRRCARKLRVSRSTRLRVHRSEFQLLVPTVMKSYRLFL